MKNEKSKLPTTFGTNLQTKEIKEMNKLQEVEMLIEQGYEELSAWYMVYGDCEGDWTNPEETDDAI